VSVEKDKTMRCRSILKWIGLTAISLTIVFLLSTIAHDETASAAIDRSQTQGSLEAFDQNGKSAGECPLKHTEVKAQVSGFLSRVTVTQDFENKFSDKIEAVYTFPLPHAAAVHQQHAHAGNRIHTAKRRSGHRSAANYAGTSRHGSKPGLEDKKRNRVLQDSLAKGSVVSKPDRALGVDRDAGRVV